MAQMVSPEQMVNQVKKLLVVQNIGTFALNAHLVKLALEVNLVKRANLENLVHFLFIFFTHV